MYARIYSYALDGLDARPIAVEVDVRPGLPSFTIVGLGDLKVRETRERVRCALQNQGYELPQRRITVNVAPASLPKTCAGLDLPIALGILVASQQTPAPDGDVAVVGDLALGGQIRPVRGVLAIAEAARRDERTALVVPAGQLAEAAIAEGLPVREVQWLTAAPDIVGAGARDGRQAAARRMALPSATSSTPRPLSLDDVRGHDDAKRRIRKAAKDARSVLLIGSMGTGKTMLARRIPGLLPAMTAGERVEVTRIHSVCGLTDGAGPVHERPFRAPHHGTSVAGLIGGGLTARPGEVTLAHRGVLFLDQVTEFRRDAIDALREVLRDGKATLTRHSRVRSFPARTMLVGATTACPCGHGPKVCRCTDEDRERHDARLDEIHGLFDVVIDLAPQASEVR
jgi:magnesium chelatase family protein